MRTVQSGMAWFAVSFLLVCPVWLAFKAEGEGEGEGENWSARDHEERARKEEGGETFWNLSFFLAHPFFLTAWHCEFVLQSF